jgi:uncharacterized protein (TIGR02453 family)
VPAHFQPELFRFLKDLKRNNRREWFVKNKTRYEEEVRDPFLSFIADFGPRLESISRRMVADPRPMGGSLFRIYRDTRFSPDKSPYKTAAGAHFRHETSKDVHAPGFYLHLEPGMVFGGCGIWRPDAPTQKKIRDAIVKDPARWKRAVTGTSFRRVWKLDGETLSRQPRGYDPDHPLIEDLKRKDFTAGTPFTEKAVASPDFLARFSNACQASSPFMEFLCRALGLPW